MDDCENLEEIPIEEEDVSPIDLASLPTNLRYKILTYWELDEIAKFEETSQFSRDLVQNSRFCPQKWIPSIFITKNRVKLSFDYCYSPDDKETPIWPHIPWHVAIKSQVRFSFHSAFFPYRVSGNRLRAVAKLFEQNKSQCTVLSLTEHIIFEPEDLRPILKALKIQTFDCKQFIPRKFFQSTVLNEVQNMHVQGCGCTDDDLVNLKIECFSMRNDFITARGLNRFLRQWKNGERRIDYISIEYDTTVGTRRVETVLEGLQANPVWNPDIHDQSLIAGIPIGEISEMENGDPSYIYSLWRGNDIENRISIRLKNSRIQIWKYDSNDTEQQDVYNLLDYYQYYILTKTCLWCGVKFCHHHTWYSCQRIKQAFPLLYNSIIYGIKASRYLVEANRCAQILLGAPAPVHQLTKDNYEMVLARDAGDSLIWSRIIQLRVFLFNC